MALIGQAVSEKIFENGGRRRTADHEPNGSGELITIQGFILTAIRGAEKTSLRCKNIQSQWTMKYRSRSSVRGACLKSMPRTILISMQGITPTAITVVEKTSLPHKNLQSQWTVKYRSKSSGEGAWLKGIPRTISMQGFTLTAITVVEKT